MQKNVASQKLIVFAFDSTTNLPKTGDAANITAYVSKDYGSVTVLADTSATEMDATNAKGYYLFDLAQAETNANTLLVSAKSSTSNIVVVGSPATVFTDPANYTLTAIDGSGQVSVGTMAAGVIHLATFASDVGNLSMRSNTAQAGAATTITLDSGASATNSFYNNTLIMITGGTGVGQSRFISAYVGATKVATVGTWATNPDSSSTFAILPFDAIAGATAPTAAQNATAVWADLLASSDFSTSASVGALIKADINATISSRAIAGDAMALTSAERTSTANSMLDQTDGIESGITVRGALRLGVAADAGKTNGMGAAGIAHLRNVADSKDRVTAVVDASGNRTATTIDTT